MSDSIDALVSLSARIGADPLLVQGGGGNTSLKRDGELWVKASGAWLMHARERDVFVRLPLATTQDILRGRDGEAELARRFVGAKLRPSIETSLHAMLPHAVVLHVHSVNTIAHAVRTDAHGALARALDGLRWAWVPYRRPGVPLTEAIVATLRASAELPDVLILANHGLVVGANSCDAAERLLAEVERRLALDARDVIAPDLDALHKIEDAGWRAPASSHVHALATDAITRAAARGGVLYPDHAVFLGATTLEVAPDETLSRALARAREQGYDQPRHAIVPGIGVLVAPEISAGAEAMLECLALVGRRLDRDQGLVYLTDSEVSELTHWEAEAYRRTRDTRAAMA